MINRQKERLSLLIKKGIYSYGHLHFTDAIEPHDFLADFLLEQGVQIPFNDRKIIDFISLFQNTDTINTFTNGCCYWFAYILHSRFPELEIMYDAVANHFVAGVDGRLYDITGDVTDKYNVVAWENFEDELQRQRIVKQCIELEE